MEYIGDRDLWWLESSVLATHPASACEGTYCCLHNPSVHPLKDAPLHWRADKRIMERICIHGVGHDDPDDLTYRRAIGREATGVHGCCAANCCGQSQLNNS